MEQEQKEEQKEEEIPRENLKLLPYETLLEQLSYLDYNSLIGVCSTDTYLRAICQSDNFWRDITYKRFPGIKVPDSVDIREYYKNLIILYTITFTWIGPNVDKTSPDETQEYTLTYPRVNRDNASALIGTYESFILPDSDDRDIAIRYEDKEYSISMQKTETGGYSLNNILQRLSLIRRILQIPTCLRRTYNYTDENKEITNILARDNLAITISERSQETKISEFYNKYVNLIPKFLEVAPSLFQEGIIIGIYQKFLGFPETTYLYRLWSINYDNVNKVFYLERREIYQTDTNFNVIEHDDYITERLWRAKFA